jgi:hypothetical protein
VIATKNLKVYYISKEDFFLKLPKDVLQYFEDNCSSKCKWLDKRFLEIAKNVNKLKDTYFEGITE